MGQRPSGSHVGRLFVEGIGGVAVGTKEGKAHGTLLAFAQLEMLRADAVTPQEVGRLPAYNVRARVAYEGTRHSGSPNADDAVEAAATRYGCHRLPVAKEYIEDGLPHPDDFSVLLHVMLLLCKVI